MTPNTNL